MKTTLVIGTAVASLCLLAAGAPGASPDQETDDLLLLQMDVLSHSDVHQERERERERKRAKVVEVEHLSKCGGTFVDAVVDASVDEASIGERGTSEDLEFVPGDDVFSIGLIRNPYDYLVSSWAFNFDQKTFGLSPEEYLAMRPMDPLRGKPAGTSQEDRDRFKKFVYRASDDKIGLMSLRFYGKYLDNYTVFHDHVWWTATARDVFMTYPREPVQEALASFEPPGQLDCFAKTESLENDTRHCLELYEQQAGPGSVDWEAFDEAVENVERNPTDHVACHVFYDDDENLTAFVGRTESEILRAFNYSVC